MTETKAKDWSYLIAKEPSDLHSDLAAYIAEETGLDLAEVEPEKMVQFVVAMHGYWQKLDREGIARKRRTKISIYRGGSTIAERFAPPPEEAEAPEVEAEEAETIEPTPEPATPARARARRPRKPKAEVVAAS